MRPVEPEPTGTTPVAAPPDNARDPRIPYPSAAERDAGIAAIVAQSMPARARLVDAVRELIRSVGVRGLFFGVWDCAFLGVMATACVWGMLAAGANGLLAAPGGADGTPGRVMVLMFLISPFLYETTHLLIMVKERERRTLDLWRVCRWSFRRLVAVRMLAFGAAAVMADVAGAVAVDAMSGSRLPMLTMLGVSFSSLFLFALGQLAVDVRCAWPASAAVMPAAWTALSGVAWMCGDRISAALERLPEATSLCVAAGLAALFAAALSRYVNAPAARRAKTFA